MTDHAAPDLLTRLGTALAGSYRIERVLGQGGMGTVFLAQDITLERLVAIKVISPEVGTSPEIRQRFAQEAKTVARLRQPNIVAVYSAGEADGLLYFVMEYVPGESLRDRLTRDRRIPVNEAVDILRDLALALDYAHNASVIHRDVKPENVLLDRESGRAMLTDFGVARAFSGDTRLTGAGFVLGSPRYMSPEQAAGDGNLDGRSDLYSLGLIGYEMLSGEPAVDAPSAASILVKHLTYVPPSLTQVAPGTPVEVVSTIARLLEKSPDARFQRGAAAAAALTGDVFDDKTPTNQIGRASAGSRQKSAPPTRSKLPWLFGGIAAVSAAAALWMGLNSGSVNDKSWLVAPFEVQGGDATMAWLREGSLNMLTLSLAQWTDLQVVEYERALDLLRDAGLDDDKRVGLEDARAVAKKAGAGRVIMGQVTTLGDSMIVTANMYDVGTGRSTDKARVAAIRSADPRPLFEAVASQLLDLVGAPRVSIELAKQTTTSVVAYRHYLDGLRQLNRWRLREADSSFSQAIAADSTFALAYYKKSLAIGWIAPGLMEQGPLMENAIRYVDRLPSRQQELVRGHVELNRGFEAIFIKRDTVLARQQFMIARDRMRRLIASDTADAEAWYSLADADYHLVWNTSMGMSPDSTAKYLTSSMRAFHRTIALDSTFHLAFQHLADMYQQAATPGSYLVLSGDSILPGGPTAYERRIGSQEVVTQMRAASMSRAREAAAGWRAADPEAPQAVRTLSDTYIQMRQPDSAIAVLVDAQSRPALRNTLFAWRIPILQAANARSGAAPTLRALVKATPVDSIKAMQISDRITTLFALYTVAGQTGSPTLIADAVRILPQTDPVVPGSAFPMDRISRWLSAGMQVALGTPVTAEMKRTLVDGVRELDATAKQPGGNARSQYIVPYLAYLATRDTTFLGAVQRWGATPTNDFPELRALALIRSGDTAGAQRILTSLSKPDSVARSLVSMNGLRVIARAEAFTELGDLRTATALYEAIDPIRFAGVGSPEMGWPVYIRSFLIRGRLYEQLGDQPRAVASYEQFVRWWSDAEAPLQPQLREAREAIARLKESPNVPVRGAAPAATKGGV
ncbi:MAG: protein kinase [Gemmatimonadaceae bacterium]|nr:protein kinase [Gemmatimonadaceae bacterium]